MEERLGTPLLQRSTRRQRLTGAGNRFYDRCRVILAEVEAAEDVGGAERQELQGRLRVSAPVGFGVTLLAPLVANLTDLHEQLEIELILTDRYVDLIAEGFDAVIRLGPLSETNLSVTRLADHEQVVCASPSYLARHGTPLLPADLGAHHCLGFVNQSGRPYAEWRFGREGRVVPVSIRSRFRTNDGRVLVAAAVAGHGIILQPRAVVADAQKAGTLVPILTDYTPPSRPMFLLHSPRKPEPRRLTTFVDFIEAAFPAPD